MAIDINTAFTNTNGVAYPDSEAINASGPTATDGTEYVKVLVDNFMFGPQQALLNHAGLVPNGTPEADGASQELEALKKSFGNAGEAVDWYGDLDPAVLGLKILLLQGQGILIANYQELTDVVYVGDGNNATAPAFFKADDAAGTIRNTAGIYLILPDAQDVYPRFVGETVYSARIDNNGAASVISESLPFIQSVSRTSVGVVLVTYIASFFTEIPSVIGGHEEPNIVDAYINARNSTTASVEIRTLSDTGAPQDEPFALTLQRQDTDYSIYPSDFIRGSIRY